MSNKNETNQSSTPEEFKEVGAKPLSKFEYDLYNEEEDIAHPVIRVKRVSLPNKGEKWKIFENSKVVFIIEGLKLTKKEKEFLRTIDGINFLLDQYKKGINSFNAFKKEIKKKIK